MLSGLTALSRRVARQTSCPFAAGTASSRTAWSTRARSRTLAQPHPRATSASLLAPSARSVSSSRRARTCTGCLRSTSARPRAATPSLLDARCRRGPSARALRAASPCPRGSRPCVRAAAARSASPTDTRTRTSARAVAAAACLRGRLLLPLAYGLALRVAALWLSRQLRLLQLLQHLLVRRQPLLRLQGHRPRHPRLHVPPLQRP